jgi:hypothetical protein
MTSGIYKRSEEHRKKMSLSHLGKSSGMLGKFHSEETRRKISEALKGKMPKNINQIKGWYKGKHLSEEHKRNMVLNHKRGKEWWNWKGDKAGKYALHIWLWKNKPKPLFCEECGENKRLDLANIKNHKYTRNPKDYRWLCRGCHIKFDREK